VRLGEDGEARTAPGRRDSGKQSTDAAQRRRTAARSEELSMCGERSLGELGREEQGLGLSTYREAGGEKGTPGGAMAVGGHQNAINGVSHNFGCYRLEGEGTGGGRGGDGDDRFWRGNPSSRGEGGARSARPGQLNRLGTAKPRRRRR
jgi:hypothetical protein